MGILAITISVAAGYIAVVLIAELLIWKLQPEMQSVVTLFVRDSDGTRLGRNLYGHEFEGNLYVSSNHWLRKWYRLVLNNPDIEIARDGIVRSVKAVAVGGQERERVLRGYNMGFVLRLVCGFAPSRILRLEPSA